MKKKFGTFKGVFVPSTEAILGTVLFLLLPVLTADVGLIAMMAIIILAHTVTIATSFSIADCATNLHNIGGGGMYALSKRSLGLAFGGSIGIQLFLAQAASIGFYCIGFAEPLQPILASFFQNFQFFQGGGHDTVLLQKQVIATAVLIIFLFIVITGADFTLKIQMLILVVLFGSIGAIFISPVLGDNFIARDLFTKNLGSINLFGNRALTLSIFILAFTQFFPAVTGIDAGVGMSGELADPKKSLVKGTFYSIAITFIVYIVATTVFSFMDRHAVIAGYAGPTPIGKIMTGLLGFHNTFPYNAIGFIVLLGILFATSSSALSCFMTAPRTARSLSRDELLPSFMNILKKDFFRNGTEPRFATLATFFIGLAIIWAGTINVAAMIVGICYLVVYGWVNGSAFFERTSQNPTFRPTSRGHWVISLYGFLASMAAIMIFSWYIGLAIIASQYIMFRLILKYKAMDKLEGVWWGVLFSLITRSVHLLDTIVQGAKNWRPILVAIAFSGNKSAPEKISYLANLIASYKGIVNYNIITTKEPSGFVFDPRDYPVSPSVIVVDDPTASILGIIQMNNNINMTTNTVLLEYSKQVDMIKIIKQVLALDKNLLMLKNGEKLAKQEQVDIWWRGERNGNLMVMMAYIIRASLKLDEKKTFDIRIIRKLDREEDIETARMEMLQLLDKARLRGEIVLLQHSDDDFMDTVSETSRNCDLILMGLPGNYTENGTRNFFNLNEFFFRREINRYDDLPAIIFVKSAQVIDLIED